MTTLAGLVITILPNPKEMHMLRTLAAAVLGCLLFIAPASANESCAPWEQTLVDLYNDYGELPAHIAVVQGGVLIVTVNPQTGTFTVLIQPNEDAVCFVGAGEHWSAADQGIIDNILDEAHKTPSEGPPATKQGTPRRPEPSML